MARILLIANQAESLLHFRGDLIASLQAAGHAVLAAVPDSGAALMQAIQARGVEVFPVPMARTGLNPLADLWTCYRLYQVMRRQRPDCVLAYTVKSVIYGMIAGRLAGIRKRFACITGLGFAFTEAGAGWARRLLCGVVTRLYKISLVNVAGVIFLNPDDQKFFLESKILRAHIPVHCMHGEGVNIGHYVPTPLPEAPIFLMIGRLLVDKGVREYIAAAHILKAHDPHARCQLLGVFDSNPSAITQAEFDSWIREGVVEYLGVVQDVRPVIGTASVFVLPSYREGTSRATLEAMAMGRAIISTNTPGCRQTVEHGVNGLLVPARDAQALALAMIELANDSEKRQRYGAASRAIAESLYDVRKVNEQMMKVMGLVE